MDLNDVGIFVEVVEASSFSGAARRLGVPANTVSRRMKMLEEGLGVRLLHRSTRKLILTDAGQSLYDRCNVQVSDLKDLARQFVGGSQEPSGRVRVAAPADFFDVFQMGWVSDFLQANSKVHLDFILSDNHADLIAEGIDVAFRAGPLPESSVIARKISTGRMVLAASPQYVGARGIPLDVYSLADHVCIRSSSAANHKAWRLQGRDGLANVGTTGRFSANTAQAQLKAAVAGLGICLLPASLLRKNLEDGSLVPILPDYGSATSDFCLVYPSRRQIPLAVKTFADHALRYLQAQASMG